VFPRLATVGTTTQGEGVNLVVHFTKKQGAPVHYVGGDDPAAAVREVDLRKKFHLQRNELATKIGLSPPKAKVLRAHLGIDDDPSCCTYSSSERRRSRAFPMTLSAEWRRLYRTSTWPSSGPNGKADGLEAG